MRMRRIVCACVCAGVCVCMCAGVCVCVCVHVRSDRLYLKTRVWPLLCYTFSHSLLPWDKGFYPSSRPFHYIPSFQLHSIQGLEVG